MTNPTGSFLLLLSFPFLGVSLLLLNLLLPLFLSLILLILLLQAVFQEMTVEVSPRTEDCFFFFNQEAGDVGEDPGELRVEYQVLNSRGGPSGFMDTTVHFRVVGPLQQGGSGAGLGAILVAETRKEEGFHTFEGANKGEYKVCFDNNFSFMNTKTIYFNIETSEEKKKEYIGEEKFGENAEEIKNRLDEIMIDLRKSQNLQNKIKATDTKDRVLAESSFERVLLILLLFSLDTLPSIAAAPLTLTCR